MKQKTGYFTGRSTLDIFEAINNALEQAGKYAGFEIVESFCSRARPEKTQYKVVLSIFSE